MDGDQRLGLASRDMADQALRDNLLFVSAISFWEVALLTRRGRLTLAYSSGEWRRIALGLGIVEIPLTGEIGILAAELEGLPGDPADRIITATALLRGQTLLTSDRRILDWQGLVARHDARV
jgi:PIN domain nuclease of toxin-antitoxin system|tara:strand:+ start:10175 stop:10540 length:366 start_codon:yes stop_codon:yes gene_type:complete